jgi:hypothetical protein
MDILFTEKQKFTQKWLYSILILLLSFSIIAVYNDYHDGIINFTDFNTYKGSLLTSGFVFLVLLLIKVSCRYSKRKRVSRGCGTLPFLIRNLF